MGCGRCPCWCSTVASSLMTCLVPLRRWAAPRSANGCEPHRTAAGRGRALLAGRPPRHQGAGSFDGGPARRPVGHRHGARWPARHGRPAAGRLRNRSPRGWQPGPLGVLAGLLLVGGRLTGESPGARDNGSGLLAVLTAAEADHRPRHRDHHHRGRGVRAGRRPGAGPGAAGALRREAEVLNVDTIDDEGTLFVVTHGPGRSSSPAGCRKRLAGLAPDPGTAPAAGDHGGWRPAGHGGRRGRHHRPAVLGYPEAHALPPGMMPPGMPLATAELLGERLAAPI